MFKIETDISALTKEQREAIAGFILTFPADRQTLNTVTSPPLLIPAPKTAVISEMPKPEEVFTVTTDAAGLPWDERIHSASKTMTADGFWRKRRGVEEPVISQVEAELYKLMSIPVPSAAPVPPVPVVPPPPAVPAPPTPIVPEPEIAAVPAPPPVDGKAAFIAIITKIGDAVSAGKLTQAQVAESCVSMGAERLPDLQHRPDLIPGVDAIISAIIAGK